MDTMGRHVIADFWKCHSDILDDQQALEKMMTNAALHSGADIQKVIFHKFHPQGISGVVVISESHLSIHSFPEHKFASIDVYTCGDSIDPQVAANYISEHLQAEKIESILVPRGIGMIHAEPIELKTYQAEQTSYNYNKAAYNNEQWQQDRL